MYISTVIFGPGQLDFLIALQGVLAIQDTFLPLESSKFGQAVITCEPLSVLQVASRQIRTDIQSNLCIRSLLSLERGPGYHTGNVGGPLEDICKVREGVGQWPVKIPQCFLKFFKFAFFFICLLLLLDCYKPLVF